MIHRHPGLSFATVAVMLLSTALLPTNHLISESAKATCKGADGVNPPPCFQVISLNCGAVNSAGNGPGTLSPCGRDSVPNCLDSCVNACSNSSATSWMCINRGGAGNLASCPTMQDSGTGNCGFQSSNGNCTGDASGCYCVNGTINMPQMGCQVIFSDPNPFIAPGCPPTITTF